jgi:hypothetical protein
MLAPGLLFPSTGEVGLLKHLLGNFAGRAAPLVVVALCALLGAQAVGTYLGAGLVGDTRAMSQETGKFVVSAASVRDRQALVATVVARNMFCSDCAPRVDQPDTTGGTAEAALNLDGLRLIATLVSEEDDAWSFAAIREQATGEIGLFGVGSELPGGGTVTSVEERQVAVQHGAATGLITLQPLAASASSGSAPTAARPRTLLSDLAAGVRKVGDGHYVIRRRLLQDLMARSPEVARWARIVPRTNSAGKPAGFALHRIHPRSIYALLGLKNGDAIRAVNGRPLTPEAALALYSRLQSASHFTVSLERRGKTLTHDYTIQ